MNGSEHNDASFDWASRVRANAGSAGLGAGCLLYFGFFSFLPGQGPGLLPFSWNLSYYAFRIGGALMALVAAASLSGASLVLLIDAVVSVPLGAIMLLSGVLRLLGRGNQLEAFLLGIGGYLFIRAGWNNAKAFLWMRTRAVEHGAIRAHPTTSEHSMLTPPDGSLAERIRARRSEDDATVAVRSRSITVEEPVASVRTSSRPVEAPPQAPPPEPVGSPPPDGFLASFAPKDRQE